MATRSASTFSGPRMTFCRCSTGRSIPPCIVWRNGDGLSPNGKRLRIAIGNSSITDLRIREESNLRSGNLNGSKWQKPWPEQRGPPLRRAEMRWWKIRKRDADVERELQSDLDLEQE